MVKINNNIKVKEYKLKKDDLECSSSHGLYNFLMGIREEYKKAREPMDSMDGHIIRGRSHSISSNAEDLLAKCYKESFGKPCKDLYIFVDRSISLSNEKVEYPDIIVTRKIDKDTYKVLALADLKQDVGWIRDKFEKISIKHNEYCKKLIKLKEAFSYMNKGDDKSKIKFIISQNLRYDTLIITALNAGNKENVKNLVRISDNQKNNILVLDRNTIVHPNEYIDDEEFEKYMEPNYKHWNKYIYNIAKNEWEIN